MRARSSKWLARVLLWSAVSGFALVAGYALLVTGVAGLAALRAGGAPGELQHELGFALALAVLEQALLPLWAATLASWIALARIAPWLDRRFATLAPGIALAAALWFAPIAALRFEVWTPTGARDVAGTLLLCAGGVSAALLLPRVSFRALAPGALLGEWP